MIAIIADDFTGAAELAGISLRYGLKVELCTADVAATDADVVIVSTDSRSLNKTAALEKTAEAVKQVLQLKPSLVYKKIDSVLRGYVLDELRVQMQLMQKSKAFILPANPSLNRTISNGMYYVEGTLISETGFASDPEFPVKSSLVKQILNKEAEVRQHNNELPATGFIVGEATTDADVQAWAAKMNDEFVLAGAGDFYTALLEQRFELKQQEVFQLLQPFLYVCGTAYEKSINYIKEVSERSEVVLYVGKEISTNDGAVTEEWWQQCRNVLSKEQKAIIAVKKEELTEHVSALTLRNNMAKLVKQVVEEQQIKELFIEGGSTATAILNELNITKLSPLQELTRGVVRMKANNLYITVKPGSYELSNEIKQLFSQ
ncbi:four-carbon acid sugar kinase family protein [Lacibacter luteus]|uniref:Four-carbon acid sugar kinase family protein n=1 Tax=Lacibacter luteus TaxID=2508719 RepID=A0A4Q1CE47_9BACT|nr:four-carbon acid sugar kinase family protein [Lacibacter luteus]RXK58010.1 four-carbon acid sugar kinase family protein [Lacibacter luteus]